MLLGLSSISFSIAAEDFFVGEDREVFTSRGARGLLGLVDDIAKVILVRQRRYFGSE